MGGTASKNRRQNKIGFDNCLAVTGIQEKVCSFRWLVQNFKERLQNEDPKFQMYSPLFRTTIEKGKIDWQIVLKWSEVFNDQKYLSLFLHLKRAKKPTRAVLQFAFVNAENKIRKSETSKENEFTASGSGWGWLKFVKIKELLNENNGMIEDGNLKIQCKITIRSDVVQVHCDTKVEIGEKSSNRTNEVISDFTKLYHSSTCADVTIKTKTSELKAHKAILSCRSSVFEAMFQHDMSEAINNSVEIFDFEHDVVKGMLEYFYCGKVPQNVLREKSDELLKIADKYDIRGLKEDMENAIAQTLTIENVAGSIILADMSGALELKEKAIKFINMNKCEVMKNEEFQKILRENPLILEQLYLAE